MHIETSLLSRCFSGLLCSVRRGLMCIGLGVGPIVGRAREWLLRRAGARGVSRPRWRQSRSPFALPAYFGFALGVGDQAGEDGVTDAPRQATQRLFVGLAFF